MATKSSLNFALVRLRKEYEMLQKNPVDYILPVPNPNNYLEWHFVIYGLKSCPYEGGFYHGKLILPPEYPWKPPSLHFITPSGRFKPGEKICLSFTNFHPETWSCNQRIESMLVSLVSFMCTDENTTGAVLTSSWEKRTLARQSLAFNMRNNDFVQLFSPFFNQIGINADGTAKAPPPTITENESVASTITAVPTQNKLLFIVISAVVVILAYVLSNKKSS